MSIGSELHVDTLRLFAQETPIYFNKNFSVVWTQTLIFGFLGLMPMLGDNLSRNRYQFFLQSLRNPYFCVISTSATLFLLVTFAMMIDKQNFCLASFIGLIVYLSNLFTIILFFKLGSRWKILISSWTTTVKSLPLPRDTNFLRYKLNLRLFVIASSSLSKMSLKHAIFPLTNWLLKSSTLCKL